MFMAMEFLQGGSLTTHITRQGHPKQSDCLSRLGDRRRGRLSLEETAFYVAEAHRGGFRKFTATAMYTGI